MSEVQCIDLSAFARHFRRIESQNDLIFRDQHNKKVDMNDKKVDKT